MQTVTIVGVTVKMFQQLITSLCEILFYYTTVLIYIFKIEGMSALNNYKNLQLLQYLNIKRLYPIL